jgi:parallel beta-helix repeat protein
MAVENILFDNHEAGVSVESVEGITVRYNTIVGNEKYQILSYRADYDSDDNCFAKDSPDQLIADFSFADRYMALAEYQKEMGQDLNSIEGNCGALPEKIDVHRLNAETKRYTPWAREKLGIAHNMK